MTQQRHPLWWPALLALLTMLVAAGGLAPRLALSSPAPPTTQASVGVDKDSHEVAPTEDAPVRAVDEPAQDAHPDGPPGEPAPMNMTPQSTAVGSPCVGSSVQVDVRDFGASGNDQTDDSKAIQAANDAVAAKGGGRVRFPAGTFRTYGVRQDSCVEFAGEDGSTLLHPDGTSPASVVQGRLRVTTGSITSGSDVLTVKDKTGIRPGAIVAVQAAGGMSSLQQTELGESLAPTATTITVQNAKGLPPKFLNYVYVGDEIVSYAGIRGNVLQKVERGLFGTEPVFHLAGTALGQARRLYAEVESVQGNQISLERSAPASAVDAHVYVGSIGMSVRGLTIDGNRRADKPAATNPFPLHYELARWVTVADSTIRNGDIGGISLDMGTRDSLLANNVFSDDRGQQSGSGVWLFRGAARNTLRGNTFKGDTLVGVMVDDRTVQASEFDAASNGNLIEANTIDIAYSPDRSGSAGVVIESSSDNTVVGNKVSHARNGILVAKTSQSPNPGDAARNDVRNNTFSSHQVGINVSGSNNEFVDNVLQDTQTPTADSGQNNRFSDNTVKS